VPRGRCRRVGTVLTEWHRPRPVLDDRQRRSGDRRATSLSFYGPSALFLLIGVGHRIDRRVCAAPVGPGRAAGRGQERRECGDRSVPPYRHAAAIPSASLWPRLTPPLPGRDVTVRLPAPSRRGPALAQTLRTSTEPGRRAPRAGGGADTASGGVLTLAWQCSLLSRQASCTPDLVRLVRHAVTQANDELLRLQIDPLRRRHERDQFV